MSGVTSPPPGYQLHRLTLGPCIDRQVAQRLLHLMEEIAEAQGNYLYKQTQIENREQENGWFATFSAYFSSEPQQLVEGFAQLDIQ